MARTYLMTFRAKRDILYKGEVIVQTLEEIKMWEGGARYIQWG